VLALLLFFGDDAGAALRRARRALQLQIDLLAIELLPLLLVGLLVREGAGVVDTARFLVLLVLLLDLILLVDELVRGLDVLTSVLGATSRDDGRECHAEPLHETHLITARLAFSTRHQREIHRKKGRSEGQRREGWI